MRVCIGGTFDTLHKGHKRLISKAFETAGKHGHVYIGVTKGDITKKKIKVETFEKRKKNIEEYLLKKKVTTIFSIVPIQDKYGLTLDEDFDVIVVSPETYPVAEEINMIRQKKGRKTMEIIQVPFVLAEDNIPINSSRIRKKEIDKEGRILKRD